MTVVALRLRRPMGRREDERDSPSSCACVESGGPFVRVFADACTVGSWKPASIVFLFRLPSSLFR